MDGGGMSGHNSVGRVSLNCGVVDVRGLNNLWDWDSTWDSNLIRLGDMGDLDNLTGNGTWDSNWDINIVLLDIDLWDNVGELGGDSGVSSDGSKDSLLDNGVSGSRASWDGCRGDGSIRCWGSRDDWSGKGNGVHKVLGRSGNIRMGSLGDGFVSSNGISMTSNNLLDSNLDGSLSNQSIFNTVLNYWGTSSIRSMSLSNHCRSGCNWSSDKATSISQTSMSSISQTSMSNKTSMSVVSGGSTVGTGHKGKSNTKSVHVSAALFRSNSQHIPAYP